MGFQVIDSTGKIKIVTPSISGVLSTAHGGTSVDIASAALPLGSGQITFPAAQNASSNVNTLDDYERGTWTPVDASGASLALTNTSGQYVKIGQMVLVSGRADYPSTADGSTAFIGGLPFTIHASSVNAWAAFFSYTTYGSYITFAAISNTTTLQPITSAGSTIPNSSFSTKIITFTAIYRATA